MLKKADEMGTYKHYPEEPVGKVLNEIYQEFKGNYKEVVDKIIYQIHEYYMSLPILHNKKPHLIISLSGGVDSTVVTYLAVRSVSKENVIAVTLPDLENDNSLYFSKLVASKLKIEHYVIPIGEIVDKKIMLIEKHTPYSLSTDSEDIQKLRRGNLASRTRISLVYDIAKAINGRILGTGNRTEYVQGYATKWGTPLSYDYGVLDELYKTEIYKIADILGIPQEIINAQPTTGFYREQTHEKELGATLEEQDITAYLLYQKHIPPSEVIKKYKASKEYIYDFAERYNKSQHKRMIKQQHVKLRDLGW